MASMKLFKYLGAAMLGGVSKPELISRIAKTNAFLKKISEITTRLFDQGQNARNGFSY